MSFKVKNIIKVSEKIIENLLEKYANDEYFSLDRIIPVPEKLELYDGSQTTKAMLYAIYNKNDKELYELQEKMQVESKNEKSYEESKNTKLDYLIRYLFGNNEKSMSVFDIKQSLVEEDVKKLRNEAETYNPYPWEAKLGIKTFEELGNYCLNNIIEYDAICRRDWCDFNWGTKGMAIIYEHKEDELVLETEWSTPIGIIDKLSKEFPDTIFSVEFASNGDDSCGKYEIKNGELVNCMDLGSSDVWRIWNYTIDGKNNENEQQINDEYDDEWEDEMY